MVVKGRNVSRWRGALAANLPPQLLTRAHSCGPVPPLDGQRGPWVQDKGGPPPHHQASSSPIPRTRLSALLCPHGHINSTAPHVGPLCPGSLYTHHGLCFPLCRPTLIPCQEVLRPQRAFTSPGRPSPWGHFLSTGQECVGAGRHTSLHQLWGRPSPQVRP